MSKRTIKLVSVLLIAIMAVVALATVVSAENVAGIPINTSTANMEKVQDFGGKIVGLIQIVGTIAAVVILMIVGIKYMMGSAEEKAEYKKTMIPYILGAVILFTAANLVNIIYNMAQNIK